jgi:hypothetical protein
MHFRARSYDPRIARFTSREPQLPDLPRRHFGYPSNPLLNRDRTGRDIELSGDLKDDKHVGPVMERLKRTWIVNALALHTKDKVTVVIGVPGDFPDPKVEEVPAKYLPAKKTIVLNPLFLEAERKSGDHLETAETLFHEFGHAYFHLIHPDSRLSGEPYERKGAPANPEFKKLIVAFNEEYRALFMTRDLTRFVTQAHTLREEFEPRVFVMAAKDHQFRRYTRRTIRSTSTVFDPSSVKAFDPWEVTQLLPMPPIVTEELVSRIEVTVKEYFDPPRTVLEERLLPKPK